MLKKIVIKNFQSHKESTIELSDGINLFCGNSDAGKSAIMRGIQWLVFNPVGDSFVSWWACQGNVQKLPCSVSIDGVERSRSSDFNGYKVKEEDNTMSVYEAMRGEVPEQVMEMLKIGEVNVQRQLDAPFLLSMSAGERSRYINQLVQLDSIDKWTKCVKVELQHEGKNFDRLKVEKADAMAQMLALGWVKEFNPIVDELSKMEPEIEKLKVDMDMMCLEIRRHADVCMEVVDSVPYGIESLVESMESIKSELVGVDEETNSLSMDVSAYDSACGVECPDVDVKSMEDLISEISNLDAEVCDLSESVSMYDEMSEIDTPEIDVESMQSILDDIGHLSAMVSQMELELDDYDAIISMDFSELDSLKSELSKMACPMCGHVGCACV